MKSNLVQTYSSSNSGKKGLLVIKQYQGVVQRTFSLEQRYCKVVKAVNSLNLTSETKEEGFWFVWAPLVFICGLYQRRRESPLYITDSQVIISAVRW